MEGVTRQRQLLALPGQISELFTWNRVTQCLSHDRRMICQNGSETQKGFKISYKYKNDIL